MKKYIPWFTLSIDDGFEFCQRPPEHRVHANMKVSRAAGRDVFLRDRADLKCSCCGLRPNGWIAGVQSARDKRPTLNLFYATTGKMVLFTQDHIIPKAYGGTDELENLRTMCATCNTRRASDISDEDIEFIKTHPHLLDKNRFSDTVRRHLVTWQRRPVNELRAAIRGQNQIIAVLTRLAGCAEVEGVLGEMDQFIVSLQRNIAAQEAVQKAQNEN